MNKFILAFAILVSFFQNVFAEDEVKKPNCFITIKYYQIIGETEQNVIEAETKDKLECKKKSEIYKTNFTPHLTKKKVVTFEWVKSER